MGNKAGKTKKITNSVPETVALAETTQPLSDVIESTPIHYPTAPRPTHYYTLPRTVSKSAAATTAATATINEDALHLNGAVDNNKFSEGRSEVQEPLETIISPAQDQQQDGDHATSTASYITIISTPAAGAETEATPTVEIQVEDVNGDVTVIVESITSKDHPHPHIHPNNATEVITSASLFDYPELYGQKLPQPDDLPHTILEELEPRVKPLALSFGEG